MNPTWTLKSTFELRKFWIARRKFLYVSFTCPLRVLYFEVRSVGRYQEKGLKETKNKRNKRVIETSTEKLRK